MISNIIFDFGAVLVDWDPMHLFEPYFNDSEKTGFFLEKVCPYEWNMTVDAGRSTKEATEERIKLYPEWEEPIRMYYGQWIKMMGGQIEGMQEVLESLKAQGYHLYGLTNWSAETFPLISGRYPIFSLLEGYVVSGVEKCMKPQEKIYRILLERYGLKAEESIFIDDNPANIEGGKAVGRDGIVFQTVEQLKEELERKLKIESGK